MKLPTLIITAFSFSLTLQAREGGADKKAATLYNAATTQPQFIENKGQITDQYGTPRRDIDYKLSGGDVTLFVGNGQLHYQWLQVQANSKSESRNTKLSANRKSPSGLAAAGRDAGVVNIYRMDVTLLGANKQAEVITADMLDYTENYYVPTVPDGATAHSYRKIIYKNVYPHIDWVLYTPAPPEGDFAGGIKYDFIVHPGGNVADIQLQYGGATNLQLKEGALIAATPMGSITEQAPYTYYAGTKEMIPSRFVLHGNVLSYAVAAENNNAGMVIDPSLKWATYYGGADEDNVNETAADTAGNGYIAGRTYSNNNIATSGAYQTSYSARYDGFIAKFNTQGVRQWATYYGGSLDDELNSIVSDETGNTYIAGSTESAGMASTGAFRSSKISTIGEPDALLIKLNTAGVRQWATYYGGAGSTSPLVNGFDEGYAVCLDDAGNIYISGTTSSDTGIATPGAFRTVNTSLNTSGTAFLAKFTNAGNRIWGTYCSGGAYVSEIRSVKYDWNGNIIIAGNTPADTGIATPGAHLTTRPILVTKGFLMKFTTAGQRLWGTYYGSNSGAYDFIGGMDCDVSGNIYIAGSTKSTTNIATPGAYQTTGGGSALNGDGFIAKFFPNGVRDWGTYYTGANGAGLLSLRVGNEGKLYMQGQTSSAGMATTGAYQTVVNGGYDHIFAVFKNNGSRLYATYFGGANEEGVHYNGGSVSVGKGYIYMGGHTRSNADIATFGAHQMAFGGPLSLPQEGDGILVQFAADTAVYIRPPFTDTLLCSGDTLSIPYGVTQSFRSTNNFVFELSNTSGSFASGVTTMGTLAAAQTGGVYNWVVPHGTAQSSLYRIRIRGTAPADTANLLTNIRIITTPQSPTATNNGPVCSGTSLNLASSSTTAGVSYSWSGPGGYTSTAQNPVRNPALTKYSGDYIVTINNNGCISKDTTTAAVDSTPIAITAGNNVPLCVGSDLQLTASNTTAGATYNWSGPSFSNTTQNPTINNVGLANAGVYSVYASLGNCNTATATTTVSVVNGPSVNIYPSPNDSICGNTTGSATFVATAINPGGTPSYQWYKNGTLVTTTISNTYTATGIQTGDVFYTKLLPGTGAACNTAVNSNQITMTVMPYLTPSVSISVSPDSTAWSGVMLTFTATATNAGNNPKYQWKVNGISMAGATSNVWGASNLNDKDKVTCEVTSSYICPQPQKVTSNVIGIKIKTGVNNLKSNNISTYPNPTQTTLTVEGVAKGTMIQLKDVLGRQVIHTTATQTKTVLHTAQLTAGNYLLILTTADGEVMTEKVVKE